MKWWTNGQYKFKHQRDLVTHGFVYFNCVSASVTWPTADLHWYTLIRFSTIKLHYSKTWHLNWLTKAIAVWFSYYILVCLVILYPCKIVSETTCKENLLYQNLVKIGSLGAPLLRRPPLLWKEHICAHSNLSVPTSISTYQTADCWTKIWSRLVHWERRC